MEFNLNTSLLISYIDQISYNFPLFEVKTFSPYRANFRCPLCGDSERDKTKKRCWILENSDNVVLYCHNCGISMSLLSYMKEYEHATYCSFCLEEFSNKTKSYKKDIIIPKRKNKKIISNNNTELLVPPISQLPTGHIVTQYLKSRKIDEKFWNDLYYVSKFKYYCNLLKSGTFENIDNDHPRLIFPLRDKNGKLFGINARSFHNCSAKYITIKFDEEMPKLFGMERVDLGKTIYLLEGPIDSLFVKNSLALCGGMINPNDLSFSDRVWCLDNEPRSKEMIKKMSKLITAGENVLVWSDLKEPAKDVNQLVTEFGWSSKKVQKFIESNTYSGIKAKFKFNQWKKR